MGHIRTFVCGFYSIEDVVFQLRDEGIIDIEVWIEHERKYGTHSDKEIYNNNVTSYSYSYLMPISMFAEFQNKYLHIFFANIARFDSYRGTHTAYPEAMYLFRRITYLLFDLLISKNIELVLHSSIPHEAVDYIAVSLAKVLNIKTVHLFQIPYAAEQKFFIFPDMERYALYADNDSNGLSYNIDEFTFQHAALQKYAGGIKEKVNERLSHPLLRDYNQFRSELFLAERIPGVIEPPREPFIYFPLHYQPEAAITAFAPPVWEDQALAIQALAYKAGNKFRIVLKENPAQSIYYRDAIFYDTIRDLPNVFWAPTAMSSQVLLDSCTMVATIVGTAGWEALARGKPVIFFGYPTYRALPGAVLYSDSLNLEEIAQLRPERKEAEKAAGALFSHAYAGVVSPDEPLREPHADNIRRVKGALLEYLGQLGEWNSRPLSETFAGTATGIPPTPCVFCKASSTSCVPKAQPQPTTRSKAWHKRIRWSKLFRQLLPSILFEPLHRLTRRFRKKKT